MESSKLNSGIVFKLKRQGILEVEHMDLEQLEVDTEADQTKKSSGVGKTENRLWIT